MGFWKKKKTVCALIWLSIKDNVVLVKRALPENPLITVLTYFSSHFKASNVFPPAQPLDLEQEISSWTLSSITELPAMAHWLFTHSVAVNALFKTNKQKNHFLTTHTCTVTSRNSPGRFILLWIQKIKLGYLSSGNMEHLAQCRVCLYLTVTYMWVNLCNLNKSRPQDHYGGPTISQIYSIPYGQCIY